MTRKLMIKIVKENEVSYETLYTYCARLSKKNNSTLYQLEKYLDMKLLSDPGLADIRESILTVSAEISRLTDHLIVGSDDEGF